MRRLSLIHWRQVLPLVVLLALPALAAEPVRKNVKDSELKKESSAAPDKSLAGDLTRRKVEKTEAAPALQYDQFVTTVQLQVRDKRLQQMKDLAKIIELTPDNSPEKPDLLFRMGELYFEESKYFFLEANKKDDDYIRAMNAQDQAGMERAKAEKARILDESKKFAKLATESYATIVQNYRDYKRTDEVLYFLGHNLMEQGEDRKALVAYRRLIDLYSKPPKVSKFLPDAYLAFGEYYFLNSKARRDQLEKALEYYRLTEQFPENQVYAFAIYKQGWCYFNLADYERALDKFKTVILLGQISGAAAVEKDGGKSAKTSLIREARNDYVRTYERSGRPALDARADFGRLTDKEDEQWEMLKNLANLYYENGKDKEAALTFNTLIKWRPRSPEAPGFQGKIVDCVLRAGNKKMTVDQVRRLVKIHDEVAPLAKTEKDKKALEEARELAERTLSNLAVNWHNEAKKTRDDDTFAYANEVYSDYLTLFPDNKKAYDLRFFWAELLNDNLHRYDQSAVQYSRVLDQDIQRIERKEKPGRWMVNAAYNAVLAWDEVVKAAEEAGKLKAPDVSDAKKKAPIDPLRKNLLDACLRYLKYLPDGEKRVEIAFKAANLYYRHNHFDESTKIFADIALHHADYKFETGEKAGEMAANLILDTYNLLGDYAQVNSWARKFYNDPKLATGDFRATLAQVIEESAFKLVNQMEAEKNYAKAAEAYLAFVAEFPRSAIAEKALYNAQIDFYQAKMLDRAIEVRKQLIAKYPKSEFVPQCIFGNAEAAEAIADFAEAADWYERYVAEYEKSREPAPQKKKTRSSRRGRHAAHKPEPAPSGPKQVWEEAKAQIALFNAGVFREGLGQYRQALRDREHYLELWPDSKDAEAVFLSIADLHEKNGQYAKAMKQLEDYERQYMRDANKVLMAEGRIATIFDHKLHRAKDAHRIYKRIWDYYDKLPARLKKGLDNVALDAVARAHYELSDEEWNRFAALKLRWGKGRQMADEFKRTLSEKARALTAVEKRYSATVGFKSGDPAICALYKIGLAYAHMYDAVLNAPMPKAAPPELQEAIREELMGQAEPLKEKAAEAFALTVQRGGDLDIFNDCYARSLELLRETYRPDQFPAMPEVEPELKTAARMQVVGEGLLAAIQPIPTVTAAQAAANKAKAEELKGDLADLDPNTLPETAQAPKDDDEPKGPPPSTPKSKDDEPEDML
ncbi:MAG: tetratricopeptide repeat protein [Myxococcaceae bacterium]|nr:tetratricopeptide repeat protein [Myxococcaceae bacterium]